MFSLAGGVSLMEITGRGDPSGVFPGIDEPYGEGKAVCTG